MAKFIDDLFIGKVSTDKIHAKVCFRYRAWRFKSEAPGEEDIEEEKTVIWATDVETGEDIDINLVPESEIEFEIADGPVNGPKA